MKYLVDLPNPAIVFIIEYVSQDPNDLFSILRINQTFHQRFDIQDYELWVMLSKIYHIKLPRKVLSSTISLRSKSNYKRLFWQLYQKHWRSVKEKNDYCILRAKELLQQKLDRPAQLKKLITTSFPSLNEGEGVGGIDGNWRSEVLEQNSILTLAARYCHLKCMKLMVEGYGSHIDLADMGGFTSLIICAYHGFMEGVQYCIKQGADIYWKGKLRSGVALTAEHWAAVRGYLEIFHYLRSIRIRDQNRRKRSLSSLSSPLVKVESVESRKEGVLTTTGAETSFNYDTATFDEIYLVGNQPTRENVSQMCQHLGKTPLLELSSPSMPETNTSDGSFCICGRGFVGKMIACDHDNCDVEWFHFECVGLQDDPKGAWICPACRGDSFRLPDLRIFNRNNKEDVTGTMNCSSSDNSLVVPSSTTITSPRIHSDGILSPLRLPIQPSSSSGTSSSLLSLQQPENPLVTTDHSIPNTSNNDNNSYCICGEGYIGRMIACDCITCDIEWFHFKCVGLTKKPEGVWTCPRCIKKALTPQLATSSPLKSPTNGHRSQNTISSSSTTPPIRKRRKTKDLLDLVAPSSKG